MKQSIREICERDTYLNQVEIDEIVEVSKSIQFMADFYESDVFIDVPGKNVSEAFVVAHSMPENKSIYKEEIVGKPALQENEPGVIEVFKIGKLKRDMKAITQEDKVVRQTIQPINLADKVIGVIIVEKYISEDLKEDYDLMRSVAVKEAHHRVKNNLYILISLLRKQRRLTNNEEVKSCLDNTVNRVYAILSTHKLLSKGVSDKTSVIEAIDLLVSNMQGEYSGNKDIRISISGDDFKICGDRLTSLLLSMNEIIQNCFDHAFRGRDAGNIDILIYEEVEFKNIAITDNGVGLDESKVNNDSLGTFIIDSYVKQSLKGEIERQSNKNGTKVLIKIPKQITNLRRSSYN
ncbi:MAG: histidine kinase N-terminal domain-containing protein [Clostridioides sp.]|nr:histidine kinase N-terminal domain-containing protein [Clostridioides sp.]